jgi:hypothetical protein
VNLWEIHPLEAVMKRVTWVNVALGVWLIVAPFLLGYSGSSSLAVANDGILGVLVLAGSWWIVAGMAAQFGVSGFEALCGIWLIVAPFVLRYAELSRATVNDIVVGIIVLIVSLIMTWTLTRPPIKAA